ncbi:MAG: hypothetical protein COB93_06980 [Sneathiella sp.]|nr:MAG: hypothetical protein COB93_06980 [Sneathiella sp.]
MNSFGSRFGALIKQRRGFEDLTQQALAVLAFGEEGNKARISEMENGRISNPHQRLVDALSVALKLTEADIASCQKPRVPELPKNFPTKIGLTTELVEALSWGFGFAEPKASTAEYQQFLREKAGELAQLQARIHILGEANEKISTMMSAAQVSINLGCFDKADDILRTAEESQQEENVLVQVERLSEIRAARGETSLLRGDPEKAYAHFETAVGFVAPFAPYQSTSLRTVFASLLLDHYVRFDGTGAKLALKFFSESLLFFDEKEFPLERAKTFGNIAICYDYLGERSKHGDDITLLSNGIEAYENSVRLFENLGDLDELAQSRLNYSAALRILGEHTFKGEWSEYFARSLNTAEKAVAYYEGKDMPTVHAKALNNLSTTLLSIGIRAPGQIAMEYLEGAEELLNKVLKIHTFADFPVWWAMAKGNLGHLYYAMAQKASGETRQALLRQTLEAYDGALAVYRRDGYPHYFDQLNSVRMLVEKPLS